MIRKLALAVSLALGTLPLTVSGLGLGEITTRSALNQEYDAEIELLSVATGELSSLRVALATAKAFAQAGVERPFFLSSLQFKAIEREDGKSVIKISSKFPIREPFLDFLIEVNWPKGKLVREYTVLLDPPLTENKKPVPVSAPVAQVSSQVGKSRSVTRAVEQEAAQTGEYGPIAPNETLWSIARKTKPKGVSIEQMMITLLNVNPQAFINGNINRLKKGQILRIPDAAEIKELSRREAQNAYRQQQDAWLQARTQKVDAGKSEETSGTSTTSASDAVTAAEADAELRIVTKLPEGEGEAGSSELPGKSDVNALDQKLMMAREDAESSRQQSVQLVKQVSELEDQLKDLQRLLELKDNQLAQLQVNVGKADEAIAAATAESEVEPEADAIQRGIEQAAETLEAVDATLDAEDSSEPVEIEAEVEDALAMAEETAAEEDATAGNEALLDAATEDAEPEAEIKEAEAKTAAIVEPEPEPEPEPAPVAQASGQLWYDNIWVYLAALGGLLIAALGVIFLSSRRPKEKAKDKEDDNDSLSVDTESILHDPDLITDAGPATQMLDSDTSFLSEFSSEELNALQEETSDVDPVSEADVYIAYGRYQQAQELLTQALDKEPERTALKYKLLEVFYATRDKAAFVGLATQIADNDEHVADPDAWNHVVSMGHDIDKDNALFKVDDIGGDLSTDNLPEAADLESIASDLAEEFEEAASELNAEAEPLPDDISLDLSGLADELDSALSIDDDSRPMEGLESLNLDMPALEEHTQEYKATDVDLSALSLDELGSDSTEVIDDISADIAEIGTDLSVTEMELQEQLDELSDMSSLNMDTATTATQINEQTEDSLASLEQEMQTMDESDFLGLDDDSDLNDGKPISIDEAFDNLLDDDSTEDDLSSVLDVPDVEDDDVNTKLDLARAYIEMGDAEGAKSMLEEIVEEGSSVQKAEAEKIIETL